jgi:prolyl-tRNA editing enzyme YbaK/EbsC (Cys-tRNA(Pro) deacylase)
MRTKREQARQKSQPAKHAPHHPTKSTASREFSNRMELLPTTTLKCIVFHAVK